MTITKTDLRTRHAFWFKNLKDSSKAEETILARFSEEPDEFQVWSEQNIYEQSRQIVDACEKAESSLNRGSAPNPGV